MQIEEVLPLSPLQEGLLFHALVDAQGPDLYVVQIAFDLDGPLNSVALRAAADALVSWPGGRCKFHVPAAAALKSTNGDPVSATCGKP